MMRSLRKMLVAVTSVALPVAFLLTNSLTAEPAIGETPDFGSPAVVHAVGESSAASRDLASNEGQQPSEIQLVAGSSRGGLLNALGFGSNNETQSQSVNHSHNHQQTQKTQAPSLLSGLFGGSISSKPSAPVRLSGSGDSTSPRQPADWSGIPYHTAHPSSETQTRTPIRDPGTVDPNARIIRGRSPQPHTVSRSETSGSYSSGQTASRIPTPPTGIPQPRSQVAKETSPPATSQPIASATPAPSVSRRRTIAELSSETSSRRSGRRLLDTFDPSTIKTSSELAQSASSENRNASVPNSIELVPRVARREIQSSDQAIQESLQAQEDLKKAEQLAAARAAAAERLAAQNRAADKLAAQKRAAEQAIADKIAADRIAADRIAAEKMAAEKLAAQERAAQKLAAQKLAAQKLAADKLAADKLAADKLAAEQAAAAEKLAVDDGKSWQATPGFELPTNPHSQPAGPSAAAFSPNQFVRSDSDDRVVNGRSMQLQTPATSTRIGSGLAASTNTDGDSDGFANAQSDRIAGTKATFGQSINAHSVAHHSSTSSRRSMSESPSESIHGRQLVAGESSIASELPGIRVMTFGPGEVMIRQTRQYEIRVENRGAINANAIVVRANIPDWAEISGHEVSEGIVENEKQKQGERLVWKIKSLPAGSVERMFVKLRAERSGTHDLDVDWTLVPEPAVATVKVHEPRLDLTIDGPEEVVYGESQAYTVRVLNPGDGTAANVVFTLSPNSATPQTQRIGDIPAGKEAQFEVELTAQDLVDLKIHGLASGDLDLRAEAEKTIRVSAAKLEAILTGPELRYQNTESLYNLEVQNTGTATSEQIVATLRLPGGVTYLGGLEEAKLDAGTLAWTIPTLRPGATSSYQFRCEMVATGNQKFVFDCKGTAAGETGVALATRVESIADLVLSINDPPAPAPIGSDVTYEIVVRNRGSKEATDVRAIAQFSHGIEPNRIEGQTGELLTGQVLFDPIKSIAAGQEVRLRVVAKADRAGHHRFRTEIRSGDTVLVAEEATHYMSPQSDRVSRRSSDSESR
ncbi:Large cysteine-rich periplasmic protein OmcB [Novipirellula aureliae]|uniref:Large cysteine-rich periplasmic protein OmcB n=1 Tax=Novipirellula aureliae TaxID=2527966 RepID=A0A5C6DYT9_9BACT|nr:histone H1-like repetitive region-containing protein [Novipirellula aureliae]TWU41605.1 Large cysteine-rich periplasmic protein OmcB [Novipirellula aureliae]